MAQCKGLIFHEGISPFLFYIENLQTFHSLSMDLFQEKSYNINNVVPCLGNARIPGFLLMHIKIRLRFAPKADKS